LDGYRQWMTWWQTALWGLAGGGAASVLSLSAAVVSAGYTWPWRKEGELGPRLFVLAAGLVLGSLVATAAHDQISGPWPAFIFGIGAPATIRGILSGVEVRPRPDSVPTQGRRATTAPSQPSVPEEGEVREDAP
jgi:MFS family permease